MIKDHFVNITKTEQYRNHKNLDALNYTAHYVFSEFEKYSTNVKYQKYLVDGKEYKNVICTFGNLNAPTIVIGAHYDVCGDQEGADDNASGVIGLIELARMLKEQKLNYKIELGFRK